jgi:glutaredoxin
MAPKVTLYTKPNCPLCDKALEQIEAARSQLKFELLEVNILEDSDLYERYKHSIPVVAINGVEAFRYRLSCAELVARLQA